MFHFNHTCPGGAQLGAQLNSAARLGGSSIKMRFLCLILLAFLAPSVGHSQVLYGSLTGNVADPKGSAVPGAKVEVVNTNTGEARSVTSDDRGGYTFNLLQVGAYKLTVALSSFKTLIKEDILSLIH